MESWRSKGQTMAKVYCPVCKQIVIRQKYNAMKQKSCGCDRKSLRGESHYFFKHGKEPKELYKTWQAMKSRCYYKKDKHFDRYGERGIIVCSEWINDFNSFKQWAIHNGWIAGLEIDRENNDGNYEPDNCRFVTRAINCQNKGNNKLSIQDIQTIKSLLSQGKTGVNIGKMFNVSSTMIYKIRDGKTWKGSLSGF
jgi:hypothetical protein